MFFPIGYFMGFCMGLDFPGGLIGFHEFLIRSCRIYIFFLYDRKVY